ncbi:MAG: response regulator, partial [Leptospiraceae bacterium]|nr:response regulator [Leptospiraceae bacterium]
MKKIKVAIIDDSAVVRQVLSEIIRTDSELELLFTAPDPIFALDKMKNSWPDVIVLDIEMPRMDGISFLKKIMQEKPTPVVICSTLTEENSETTMLALSGGAVEIITKPKVGLKNFLNESSDELIDSIKAASHANLSKMNFPSHGIVFQKNTADVILKHTGGGVPNFITTDKIVAIGTSTGGTQALEAILTKLPVTSPGIVIVQHMPEKFTLAFANRLNNICNIEVKEGSHLDRVVSGRALIAPGNKHM